MSLKGYGIQWSDRLIARVETHLRDLHGVLLQHYTKEGYETRAAAFRAGHHSNSNNNNNSKEDGEDGAHGKQLLQKEENDGGEQTQHEATIDVVSPAGSFMQRTCVHATPFPVLHHARGVGADLVLTIPQARCSLEDLRDGRYLERRHAFLCEVEAYLAKKVIARAARHVAQKGTHRKTEEGEGDEEEEEDEEADDEATRLSRMEVTRVAMQECYANAEKAVLRLRFRRAPDRVAREPDDRYEIFYVDLHFRPAMYCARVMNATAVRRHPLYANLLLEDYLMPFHVKTLHELCVGSDSLRRAIVLLKCWAHHVGLMAADSQCGEGLNGFVLAAMVLHLYEAGVLAATMSAESAVRTVWVQLSRGYFTPHHGAHEKELKAVAAATTTKMTLPAVEERGEAAVLRLRGGTLNLLFRSSAAFFRNVVQAAAEEALLQTTAVDVFAQVAYQPLPLRHDVALTLQLPSQGDNNNTNVDDDGHYDAVDRSGQTIKKAEVYFAPRLQQARERLQGVLTKALAPRLRFCLLWPTGAQTVQVVVALVSEAEGRSRLTRGPAMEDGAAVAAFNAFWGSEVTSTRQFPDGTIHRCVLWHFAEEANVPALAAQHSHVAMPLPATAVLRHIAQYALRKHVSAGCEVAVWLGAMEGVVAERVGAEWRDAVPLIRKSLFAATKQMQDIMTQLPRSVLPCKITGFDIVAASERHTEAFPTRPHLALTYTSDDLSADDFCGLSTAATLRPIDCVLTIDDQHKIPDTIEAIALMKGAICAQLSKHFQKTYGPPSTAATSSSSAAAHNGQRETGAAPAIRMRTMCTAQSVEVVLRGYLFRIHVAHYREVSLLRALQRMPEADALEQKLFWSVQHARFVRTMAFGHTSYVMAARLAKRWVATMMLYEFVLPEAIELLVANAYLGESKASVPHTAAAGFVRFLQLLAEHDWATPLVLPFTDTSETSAAAASLVRRTSESQAMFIAAPYCPTASPFTLHTPRHMILHRLVRLARHALLRLFACGTRLDVAGQVQLAATLFTCATSCFDLRMELHPLLLLQPDRQLVPYSSTVTGSSSHAESASEAAGGSSSNSNHVVSHIYRLDELPEKSSQEYLTQLIEREPAAHAVRTIRAALRDQAMVFYDALAPSALALLAVTAAPSRKQSQQLYYEVLRVSRGAVLPTASLTAPTATATTRAKASEAPVSARAAAEKPRQGKRTTRTATVDKKGGRTKKAKAMTAAKRSASAASAPPAKRAKTEKGSSKKKAKRQVVQA